MARHPRPPSPFQPPPPPAPADLDAGFDPIEEWLLDDFDFDQAMTSELANTCGLGDEAAEAVPGAMEPMGGGAGVPVSEEHGLVSGSGGFGVDPVKVAEEKGGLLGLFDAPRGVELDVKKEAVMLSGGLGGELGPNHQLPVLGISDSVAAKGDSLEGAIDAEMGTLAPVDAEMSTEAPVDAEMNTVPAAHADTSTVPAVHADTSTGVAPAHADTSTVAAVDTDMSSGVLVNEEVGRAGGGNGKEESKNQVLDISDDEESSEASSSSDEEDQQAKNDEESSEASSSSDEEAPVAKKQGGGVIDLEAILEEGELMAEVDDDDEDETPKDPIKSKHQVEVLPPVPKIEVQLEQHHKPLPVGTISAIMGERVVVEGSVEHSPLTEGSILWITESRTPLGIVDDIFGPVKNPYYLVRYNSVEEVPGGISAGTTVSFVAEFADHILNMKELYAKGYDESADHDEEDEPEFSDDEEEAEYKRSLRLAKRQTDRQHDSKKPSGDKKRGQARNAGFRNDMPPRIHDTPTHGHQSQRRFDRSNMAPAVADSPTHRSGSQNFSMSTPSRDIPPRIHDAPTPDHRSQHRFHRSDMAPTGGDSMTRPSGPQNFPMSAPTMLPPISMNHSMPSAVQLANQMGSCFINPSQQFSHQQPNMVWPGGGIPHPPQAHMGVDGAALAANIMQNILIGASQYQQYLQNQNFGGFPNGMPMPPQFMPGSGMPANPMPFGGQPGNHPFGLASQLPMGQGNFGQLPHMTGDQGPPAGFPNAQGFGHFPSPHEDGNQPPGFPNMQGYGRLPSPHGDGGQPPMQFNSLPSPHGDGGQPPMQFNSLPSPHGEHVDGGQPPMQFNSGQFNQGNSSFRGRRLQHRGGRHSPGRGVGGRHRK